MPAYVILAISVTDSDMFEEYKKLAPATIEAYSGRYIARAGRRKPLKATGYPIGSSFWNSTVLKRRRLVSIHLSIVRRGL
jgi:hypothetical protein